MRRARERLTACGPQKRGLEIRRDPPLAGAAQRGDGEPDRHVRSGHEDGPTDRTARALELGAERSRDSALAGADYATPADKEAILYAEKNKGRGAAPELTMLRGKRLAYISENDDDRQLDEGRVKAMTGSRATPARDLYKSHDVFENVTKIWFDLNTLPQFKGVDGGISRRPRVIPFDYTVPAEGKDRQLSDKLRAEAAGILAWAVAGAVAWAKDGLQAPAEVEYATRSYIDENNHLPRFFEETYEVTRGNHEVPSSAVQAEYALWCQLRDEPPYDYAKKVVKFMKSTLRLRQGRDTNERKWLGIRRKGL